MSEQIQLVSADDVEIGTEDKFVAHQYPVKRHRAISVWLKNKQNEVLLQQRSHTKIVGAGWWANTVCGNVWAGETYEECAVRRLKDELGIELSKEELVAGAKFEYRAYCNEKYGEHEIDQIFTASVEEVVVTPNTAEVIDTLWVDIEDLRGRVVYEVSERGYYSAKQSLLASWNELVENMHPLNLMISGKEVQVTPWTVMMLMEGLVE